MAEGVMRPISCVPRIFGAHAVTAEGLPALLEAGVIAVLRAISGVRAPRIEPHAALLRGCRSGVEG
jgi:hypothetical protein